jgi:hypothetical protein
MADYYPLIARAVAGLEKNTGDARRALYERARTALVAQLRGVAPALSESDVTRERLALEEAIRKVEAESARQTWVEPARPEPVRPEPIHKIRAPEMPRWDDLPGAAPAEERRGSSQPRADALLRRTQSPPPRTNGQAPNGPASNGMFGKERYVDPVFDQPISEGAAPPQAQPQRHPLRGRAAGERRSLLDAGLNDFRNVVSESNELGEASARSAKSAREHYDEGPPPAMQAYQHHERGAYESGDEPDMVQDLPAPRLLEPTIDDETQPMPARVRMPPLPVPDELEPASGRSFRDYIKIGLLVLVLLGLGVGVFLVWPTVSQFYASLRSSPGGGEVASETATPQQPSGGRVKDPGRYEPGGSAQPNNNNNNNNNNTAAPGAAVAQRVVLYEEDPNDPQGKRFAGSAIWRTEMVSPGPGLPPEMAVRADVEVPERHIAMTWSLRRNADPNLPASHTVEIVFKLPQDFPAGGVANVPGILMKQAEQSRGTPLSGLAVKVTNGFFLIGLSAVDADRDRNVQLLKERAWFDIPVVYSNNRRAIMALEKGTPGERAFADAFRAWKQ